MSLTDAATRQAKATGHPYTLADSDGLSLAVSAQGSKSWHFRYYWQARQKRRIKPRPSHLAHYPNFRRHLSEPASAFRSRQQRMSLEGMNSTIWPSSRR